MILDRVCYGRMEPSFVLGGLLLAMIQPLASQSIGQVANPGSIQLTDVTSQSGVGFVHSSASDGRGFIVEAMTGGIAFSIMIKTA